MLHAGGVSEAGIRKRNEDGFIADLGLKLFAVADGMGGHRAGDVASRLAIEAIVASVKESAADAAFEWPYGRDETLSVEGNRIRTAVHSANRHVFGAAESCDDYSGMGTTFTGLLVNHSNLSIASVGDSRLYLLRDGALRQLTHDDSWAEAIRAHDLSLGLEQLEHHPLRNVLTNVVGTRDTVEVHVIEEKLVSGDLLLLSTDGLHGVLQADGIQAILESTSEVEAAARKLVDAAIEHGSRDNVTALVVRFDADD